MRRGSQVRRRRIAVGLLLAAMLAAPAAAQLPPLPSLPGATGLPDVGRTVSDVARPLDSGLVTRLRETRLRELIRHNRDRIDIDEHGAPVVRGEILAVAPSAASLAAARAAGFAVAREDRLEGLDVTVVTLTPPRRLDARAALRRLRKADPGGEYDYNHVYSGAGAAPASAGAAASAAALPDVPASVRVGLVDTGVDAGHAALSGSRVEQRGFAPGGLKPAAHGTAAASLIVGRDGAFRGAASGATLLVADVYGTGPTGGSADAVARGLAWLAGERVRVINVSLVGPRNAVVGAVVKSLAAKGVIVVAAVGNDGPAAPPLFPASYAEVVAVTAVDGRDRVLLEAGRALHLDFAAPGADMAAARAGGGYTVVRGTSFAAPIVTGLLARSAGSRDTALAALAAQARDLGPPGADRQYGRGLVGAALRTPPTGVGARGVLR